MLRFVVAAKEVSSAIGLNRYQDPWKAMDLAFRRIEFGDVYTRAKERVQKSGAQEAESHEQVFERACKRRKVKLPEIKSEALTDTNQVSQVVEKGQQAIRKTVVAIQETMDVNRGEVESLKNKLKTQEAILTPAAKQEISVKVETVEKAIVKDQQDIQTLTQSSAVFTSQVRTTYGTAREPKSISELSRNRKQQVREDTRFLLLFLGRVENHTCLTGFPDGTQFHPTRRGLECRVPNSWGIGGRLDGTLPDETGTIVEVKNRTNRIFQYIPIYEQIQLECYMRIRDAKKCLLVQHFNDEMDETTVERNDKLWNEKVLPKLEIFIQRLYHLTHDETLQEEWIQGSDQDKDRIYEESLSKMSSPPAANSDSDAAATTATPEAEAEVVAAAALTCC